MTRHRIAFLSVHPDDETLGCGGTILKHRDNGDEIFWIIMTNMSENCGWNAEEIRRRQAEIDLVSQKYKFSRTVKLDFETTRLDEMPLRVLVTKLSDALQVIQADLIYVPNRSDIHSDHRTAFDAIMGASKVFNHPEIRRILMYECISETEFAPALLENAFFPNCFVDVTNYLEEKLEIMNLYGSEMKQHPFPRNEKNIRALAVFRGAQSGVEYAEAFMILRDIWK